MQWRVLVCELAGSPRLLLLRKGSRRQLWLQRCAAAGQPLRQPAVMLLSTRMSVLLQCQRLLRLALLLRLAVQAHRMP